MGKQENYRSFQRDTTDKILDDRPRPDSFPPASLLYDGFGYFKDVFSRQGDVCPLDTKRRGLETAVDSFAEKMTALYDKEADKREEDLRASNKILSFRGGGSNKLMWTSIDTGRSDTHYDRSQDAASCVIQFKNEFVDITSMPMIELTGYAAHSHKEAMGRHREVFRSWRVPCLGLLSSVS